MIRKCPNCTSAREIVRRFEEDLDLAAQVAGRHPVSGSVKVDCYHCLNGFVLDKEGERFVDLMLREMRIRKIMEERPAQDAKAEVPH